VGFRQRQEIMHGLPELLEECVIGFQHCVTASDVTETSIYYEKDSFISQQQSPELMQKELDIGSSAEFHA
jgi:hypothetical protein